MAPKVPGLLDRLKDGGTVICAEGYLWELERRGYMKAGAFTPEVVLDFPERVRSLHEEYVHAGSDVVEAFTYYGNKEKMGLVGRADDVTSLNMKALAMAREVADVTGTLMAGGLCKSTMFDPNDPSTAEASRAMFKEQVEWMVNAGADYIIGETFNDYGEAKLALEAIKEYGNGLPAVMTLCAYMYDTTTDDVPLPEACRRLEEAGAAVVGLNCGRGPATMLPLLKEVRKACKGPIAALPVPFRTSDKARNFHALRDPESGKQIYPLDLAPMQCTRTEVRQFAEEARKLGVQYIGLCCGSLSNLLREVAEAYGRSPPAAKYRPTVQYSVVAGQAATPHRRKWRHFMTGESS